MPSHRTLPLTMLTMPLMLGLGACDIVPKRADNQSMPATTDDRPAAATPTPVTPADQGAPPSASVAAPAPAPAPSATPSTNDAVAVPDDDVTAIRFPSGGTAVTIAGTADGDTDRRYALAARGGQTMRVAIDGASDALRFAVYPPGSGPGGPALVRGADAAHRFATTLPGDGRYLIQVYRARGSGDAAYRLSVAIDPPGDRPAPAAAASAAPDATVRDYYAAITAHDYRRAYRLWEDDGQASGQSFAGFRQGFGDTRRTAVRITGQVRTEGAAGSVYATVPVAVDATQADGTHRHFTGRYVLRRVNDVDGSSAADRRWHIHSAKLDAG